MSASPVAAMAELIEFGGALIIAAQCALALVDLARGGGIAAARRRVAEGVLAGLGFKLAASLLRTIDLATLDAVARFAAIFGLRLLIKLALTREARGAG